MTIEKLNKRESVADWYLANIYPYVTNKEAEIEFLIKNLKKSVFKDFEEMYNEQMSNLEAEGFFK